MHGCQIPSIIGRGRNTHLWHSTHAISPRARRSSCFPLSDGGVLCRRSARWMSIDGHGTMMGRSQTQGDRSPASYTTVVWNHQPRSSHFHLPASFIVSSSPPSLNIYCGALQLYSSRRPVQRKFEYFQKLCWRESARKAGTRIACAGCFFSSVDFQSILHSNTSMSRRSPIFSTCPRL